MLGIENYPAFVLAGVLLNITPGADTIYIVSRSIAQGRRAGVISALGIGTGALVHISLTALGLSAILAASALAYSIVRYLGAAYLMFIGVAMLLSKSVVLTRADGEVKNHSTFKIWRQGFLTNLLNPKVALFFVSFLPQFVSAANRHGSIPFLILGFTFFVTGSVWCLFLAYSASFITKALRQNGRIGKWMQKACGGVFLILGLQVALRK